MDVISLGIIATLAAISSMIGYREVRRAHKTAQLVEHLRRWNPLYISDRWAKVTFTLDTLYDAPPRPRRCVLLVTSKRLAIYPYHLDDPQHTKPLITVQPHQLRGFWRPVKYMAGQNTIWIHALQDGQWQIIKMQLDQYEMQALIRALKAISTPQQVTAYRRRRPYIHHAPIVAHPAQQTLTGAWELGAPIHLYLMPLYLVVLRETTVIEVLTLSDIQDIAALKRMEGGEPQGLVRFFYQDVLRAYALNDYDAYAQSLAEAAKRTLEDPMTRKRKSKDDDEQYDD